MISRLWKYFTQQKKNEGQLSYSRKNRVKRLKFLWFFQTVGQLGKLNKSSIYIVQAANKSVADKGFWSRRNVKQVMGCPLQQLKW
jgi:hypothetical protein